MLSHCLVPFVFGVVVVGQRIQRVRHVRLLGLYRFLIFFFWTVWSSVSVSRRSVREHAGRQSGIAWRGRSGGYDPCRRQAVQKKMKEGGASVRRSVSRPRRTRHGGAWSVVGIVPKRSEGSVIPGALGPAGFAKGRCPLASAHSRMSNTGFSRPPSILLFSCGFCGLPAVRPADLSCRLGDGSRSVPVRPPVAVDGGRDYGGETAFLVDCQRAHRGQHGAPVPQPPQYVADDGERLDL